MGYVVVGSSCEDIDGKFSDSGRLSQDAKAQLQLVVTTEWGLVSRKLSVMGRSSQHHCMAFME